MSTFIKLNPFPVKSIFPINDSPKPASVFAKLEPKDLPFDLTIPYHHGLYIEDEDDTFTVGEGTPGLSKDVESNNLKGIELTSKIAQKIWSVFNDYPQFLTSESLIACDSILSAHLFKKNFPEQNIYIFTPKGEYRATYGDSLTYDSAFAKLADEISFNLIYTENADSKLNQTRLKPGGRWIFKQIFFKPHGFRLFIKGIKIPGKPKTNKFEITLKITSSTQSTVDHIKKFYEPMMNKLAIPTECQNKFALIIQEFEKKCKIDLNNIHRIDPFTYLFSVEKSS